MNEHIKRIRDLLDSDDLYFSLSYTDGGIKEYALAPLKEENKGGRKFLDFVEKAEEYGAKEIIIRAYRKANKRFKVKPDIEEKIPLRKQENLSGFNNDVRILEYQKEDLTNKVFELKQENNALKVENQNLRSQNEDLKEKIKELNWNIKELERDFKIALEDEKRKQSDIEKLATFGGAVLQGLGVRKEEVLGLFGFEGQTQTELAPANEQREVSVSINSRAPEKEAAYSIVDEITQIIEKTVEVNPPEQARKYAQGLRTILYYMHQSDENFNSILRIINQAVNSQQATPKPENQTETN